MSKGPHTPQFSPERLPAGTRLGLAVSGGADSIALLHLASRLAGQRGWTLCVLHVNHKLRGEAARLDAAFVETTAAGLSLPFLLMEADVGAISTERGIGLEEAGRLVRYDWFRRLLLTGELDAIATGHTLDDQAETLVARLLRGSWTAGLAGIYPVLPAADLPSNEVVEQPSRTAPDFSARVSPSGAGVYAGVVVRPLLETRRAELRTWLTGNGLTWREDETNEHPSFTRNRIRHQLLPALAAFNPQIAEQFAQLSVIARDEEAYWEAETRRLLPGLLLPGRPVRGGGRASSTLPGERSVAIEVERLRALAPALVRRLLRATAVTLGVSLDFAETERTMGLLSGPVGSTPRREQLTAALRVERSPRELRFVLASPPSEASTKVQGEAAVSILVPGQGEGYGVGLRIGFAESTDETDSVAPPALLRAAKPSDRVLLRYSSGAPKRVKEVLERMGVSPADRPGWPVLEWQGEIVWLRGAVLEPTPVTRQLVIHELPLTAKATTEAPPPATP